MRFRRTSPGRYIAFKDDKKVVIERVGSDWGISIYRTELVAGVRVREGRAIAYTECLTLNEAKLEAETL